ncbi:3679_t:CDS:2 [Scutellospora calospora]|uniref:3679_t:CDS:1 n=1 Tax=Scutellospora calospora TaxID=85575 RepID=A0ACA9L8U7_9GLOM|nr:3679_t:CDS:2 [Scutellospora calospora]
MFSEYIKGSKYIEKLEGYYEHWRSKKHVLCDECRKPTASAYRHCKKYSKGYYVMQFYAQQLQILEDYS